MKKIILILIGGLLTTCFLHAQKHDYNWYARDRTTSPGTGIYVQYIDSIQDIDIQLFDWHGRVSFSPAFSDAEGEFLFFSNNFHVYDSIGRNIENGDSIAIGFYLNYLLQNNPPDFGFPIGQNGATVPISDSVFYMFHQTQEYWPGAPNWPIVDIEERGEPLVLASDALHLTTVRKKKDGSLYIRPEEKEVLLLRDTIVENQLTFVKHANGKDWWLLVPEHYSDSAYLFRIYPETGEIDLKGQTYFSNQNDRVTSIRATRSSPDGTKLARLINNYGSRIDHKLELFDFDRCTGEVDRYFFDSLPPAAIWSLDGDLAFSESGRFLYMAASEYIFQFDMELEDPFANYDTIAVADDYRYLGVLPTLFGQFWEMPNGKLLVVSLNSTPYMHYIHNPNEKGDACDFEMRAITLPAERLSPEDSIVITGLPTYPPYRMPPLDYDCETSVEEPERQSDVFVSLYPNPAWSETTVQIHGAEIGRARMLDINGRQVLETEGHGQLDVSTLPSGVYFVEVETDRGVFVRKLIVQ
jgi:hypothetical protein